MEVKISISDAEGAVVSGPTAPAPVATSAPVPAAPGGGASDAGQAGGAPGATMSAQQMGGAPAAVLARAAATGAIDAGPAPDLGGMQAGVPPPFITGIGASRMAMGVTAAESAGAAPGSEARVLTSTAPESGGGA
jgi:hypothetical protein